MRDSYTVPAEVANALATRRVELLDLLRERLRYGEQLEIPELLGMVDVIADLIEENDRLRQEEQDDGTY